MLPRVSEAARIFAIAAFLVLVAQGPTFGGREAQVAASASPDGSAATTDENKQADKKVEVTDKGETKESQSGPCTDEKKKTMSAEELAKTCPSSKEGTVTYEKPDGSTGSLGNTSGNGVVGSGSSAPPNPGAMQQYANPTTAALSQVYTPPDSQTQQRIDAAFANPSQYIGGQGSPVSAQAVAQAQNNIPASVYSPQASVAPGTTLGYDGDLGGGRSIALNNDLYTNTASLSSQQPSAGGLQAAPAYIPPTTGATMAVPGAVSPIAAGFQAAAAQWDASQPLGGTIGTGQPIGNIMPSFVAPGAAEYLDASIGGAAQIQPEVVPQGTAEVRVAVLNQNGSITGAELVERGFVGVPPDERTYGFVSVPAETVFTDNDGNQITAAQIAEHAGSDKIAASELLGQIDERSPMTYKYTNDTGEEKTTTAPISEIFKAYEVGGVVEGANSQLVDRVTPASVIAADTADMTDQQLSDHMRQELQTNGPVTVVRMGADAIAYKADDVLGRDTVYTVSDKTTPLDKGAILETAMKQNSVSDEKASDAKYFINGASEQKSQSQSTLEKVVDSVTSGHIIQSVTQGEQFRATAVSIADADTPSPGTSAGAGDSSGSGSGAPADGTSGDAGTGAPTQPRADTAPSRASASAGGESGSTAKPAPIAATVPAPREEKAAPYAAPAAAPVASAPAPQGESGSGREMNTYSERGQLAGYVFAPLMTGMQGAASPVQALGTSAIIPLAVLTRPVASSVSGTGGVGSLSQGTTVASVGSTGTSASDRASPSHGAGVAQSAQTGVQDPVPAERTNANGGTVQGGTKATKSPATAQVPDARPDATLVSGRGNTTAAVPSPGGNAARTSSEQGSGSGSGPQKPSAPGGGVGNGESTALAPTRQPSAASAPGNDTAPKPVAESSSGDAGSSAQPEQKDDRGWFAKLVNYVPQEPLSNENGGRQSSSNDVQKPSEVTVGQFIRGLIGIGSAQASGATRTHVGIKNEFGNWVNRNLSDLYSYACGPADHSCPKSAEADMTAFFSKLLAQPEYTACKPLTVNCIIVNNWVQYDSAWRAQVGARRVVIDPKGHANDVVRYMQQYGANVTGDTPLDLSVPEIRRALAAAMSKREGAVPYDEATIDAGFKAALARMDGIAKQTGQAVQAVLQHAQRYAFCIGAESCPVPGATQITEKNYLSPKDTPDTAARIEEVARAVGSPQGGVMELDDCDKVGLARCQEVQRQVAEHNAAHPDTQLKIWVNNAQLSDAQGHELAPLLSDANTEAMIAETDKTPEGRERTTPAALDRLRTAVGKPGMRVLAVGKKDFTDAFDAAAKGFSGMGSSASSAEGDEPNAYTDVVGGSAMGGASAAPSGKYRGETPPASQLPVGEARTGEAGNALQLARIPVPRTSGSAPAAIEAYRSASGAALSQEEAKRLAATLSELQAKGYAIRKVVRAGSYHPDASKGELSPAPLNGSVMHQPEDPGQNAVARFVARTLNKGRYETAYGVGIDCGSGTCTITVAVDQSGALARDNHTARSVGRTSADDLYNWNSVGVSTRGVSGQPLSDAERKAVKDWGAAACANLGACLNRGHAQINEKSAGEGVEAAAEGNAGAALAKAAAASARDDSSVPRVPYAVDPQTGTAFTCSGTAAECETALKQQVALERLVQSGKIPNDARFGEFKATRDAAAADPAAARKQAISDAYDRMYARYLASKQCDNSGCSRWKDELAARKMGMDLKGFVIQGMKPEFAMQLDAMLGRLESMGFQAGKDYDIITAFRDDFRQSIASGSVVARVGYSRHGGSAVTGGWSDGQASDIGCAAGNSGCSNEKLFAAIDTIKSEFGISRPLPGNDPYHLQFAPNSQSQALLSSITAATPTYSLTDAAGNTVATGFALPSGAVAADGSVSLVTDADGKPLLVDGKAVTTADLPKAAWNDNQLTFTDDRPTPPDPRSLWQKTQDYARNTWNSLTGNGGAQPYDAMRPAGAAQPAAGSGGGSGSSGAGGSQPQQQPQQLPLMPAENTTAQPASLTCSPSAISGDAKSKVTIAWQCPSGTTPVGSGFSTVGTLSGSITVSVATTSESVRYGIACSGTKTPQTASCTVAVKHPSVILVAKPGTLARGDSTKLEWKATDVTGCTLFAPPSIALAKGTASGSAQTLPLETSTRFRVRCETGGTPITGSVVVEVPGSASAADTVLP